MATSTGKKSSEPAKAQKQLAGHRSHTTVRQEPDPHERILELQQTVGNHAVGELLKQSQSVGETSPSNSDRERPLDSATRNRLEARLGHDLTNLKVHTGPRAAATARSLGAAAYTVDNNIVLGEGQYRPGTESGDKLLLHEAAHALHQRSGRSLQSGVAPTDSLAEQHADEIRDRGFNFETGKLDFRDWGPAWEIHRQTLKTKGTVQHTGKVGAPPAGFEGPEIGNVEVRTGDVLEVNKSTITNLISLEYSGSLAGDTRWLQFVWFELTAATPSGTASVSGNVPTSSGTKPFTTNAASPNWSVDSGPGNPFYESGAVAIRTAGGTTMFDLPGGGSVTPLADAVFKAGVGATSVTFTAHFDTYLIQRGAAAYHVSWVAMTNFTRPKGTTVASPITYAVASGGPVNSLPANLKTVLDTSYPAYKTTVK
jgi:hypothetical protein